MRKVEIKPEKHDEGWIAVERVNNRIVWKSSNFAVEELAKERCNQRIALKEREAKRLGVSFYLYQTDDVINAKKDKIKRITKTQARSLQRYEDYIELREKQPVNERKELFMLADLKSCFGVHLYIVERAISDGILPEPIKTVRNGSKARIFKFDEIKGYFNFLKELPNGKFTSAMGTQNVQ